MASGNRRFIGKTLRFVAAAALVFGLVPATAMAADDSADGAEGMVIAGESDDLAALDDGTISTWDELAAACKAGGKYTLAAKVERPSGADDLEVPAGVSATIDLNGEAIGLKEGSLVVRGSMTLKGNAKGEGALTEGAVLVDGGTLVVANCQIEGFDGVRQGTCGVEIANGGTLNVSDGTQIDSFETGVRVIDGTFNLAGGAIVKNHCGVKVEGGTLNLSGAVEVSDNVADDFVSNVYLSSGQKINVVDKLTGEDPIGVRTVDQPTQGNPVAITEDLKDQGTEANFTADDSAFQVAASADGEAVLDIASAPAPDDKGKSDSEKASTKASTKKASSSSKTGDQLGAVLWGSLALVAVSGIVLALTALTLRKKRDY